MERTRFVIIGLGNVGLPLVKSLSRNHHLVCIDSNPDTLEQVAKMRGDDVTAVQGDATSRMVLEKAGVAEADTVVLTTTTEMINLEVARLLRDHFQIPRVIAIGITQKGIEELEKLDVEVESIFAVSATGLRNRLEQRTKTVQGIGLGKNEILEVEVHPNSRLANKPLSSLRPKNWHIGLIYREGNIVIPRGNAVLKPRDRVVILGDPKVLKTTADRLSFSFRDFPLEYGDTAAVYLAGNEPDEYLEEVAYLYRTFPLERAMLVASPRGTEALERLRGLLGELHLKFLETVESDGAPDVALRKALAKLDRNPAMLIFPRGALLNGLLGKHRRKRRLLALLEDFGCPILLASGTFPYENLAIPCLDSASCPHALEKAFEIASDLNCRNEALLVRPSDYIASEEEEGAFGQIRKTVSDLSLIYKASVKGRELEGNPVKAIAGVLSDYQLLVSRVAPASPGGLFGSILNPDPGWHILYNASISAILLPPQETVL